MHITSFPEEAMFFTETVGGKHSVLALYLEAHINKREMLYHQNFLQLKLTNSFDFFLMHAIAHCAAVITWGGSSVSICSLLDSIYPANKGTAHKLKI